MISITNVSDKFDLKGVQDYAIKINDEEICRFKHRREDGLLTCLLDAAIAIHEENKKAITTGGE